MDRNAFIRRTIRTSAFRRNVYNLIPLGASRILDVGCGDGGLLLRLLREKGCTELHGVEMNATLAEPLEGILDKVWSVDIEQDESLYRERPGFFNYIVLHDVVEHLLDPWYTLAKIRSLAAEGCTVIVVTPNLHHWRLQHEIMSGKFPYGPGLWHTGHLRWYTPASLIELLVIGGLSVRALFLEIPDVVSFERLRGQDEVRRVQFPPEEFQEGVDPERIYTVECGKSVKEYVPVFYAHKLIAVCGKGEFPSEPAPMIYNCPRLADTRKKLDLGFDVYNPPHMRPLIGAWC